MEHPPSVQSPGAAASEPASRPEKPTREQLVERGAPAGGDVRERLLSFVAHEIRNPMASGLWAVEMLARQLGADPRGGRLSQLAARSIRRVRVLVEDFLALERLPAVPPPGRIDLAEAFAHAMAPGDVEARGLAAPVSGAEGLVVPLDPGTLEKLLRACLRRAAHAGEGGDVRVEVSVEPDRARVDIVRAGADARTLEPGPLEPGGSEGAGTTFTLYVAWQAAHRLGVPMEVVDVPGGAAIRLSLPIERP